MKRPPPADVVERIMQDRQGRPRQRIGPWRLLDIVTATMPWRAATFGAAFVMPEYGPPDAPAPNIDPSSELPGSNIDEGEQQAAVRREAARRFLRVHRSR
jgi:hypothetical protein